MGYLEKKVLRSFGARRRSTSYQVLFFIVLSFSFNSNTNYVFLFLSLRFQFGTFHGNEHLRAFSQESLRSRSFRTISVHRSQLIQKQTGRHQFSSVPLCINRLWIFFFFSSFCTYQYRIRNSTYFLDINSSSHDQSILIEI